MATIRRRVFDAEEGGGVVTGFSSAVDPPRNDDVAVVAGADDRVTALIAFDVAAVAAENAEATIIIAVE
jgi:hypothetical protein